MSNKTARASRSVHTFLSVADLCDRYGKHPATIWRWRKAGLLPAPVELANGVVMWRLDLLERFEAERQNPVATTN